jgi:hypothetical protein
MDNIYSAWLAHVNKPVIICPKFGSGLAGGKWDFIEELIIDCWCKQSIDVTVCYL